MSKSTGCRECDRLLDLIYEEKFKIVQLKIEIRFLLKKRAALLAAINRGRKYLREIYNRASKALESHHPRGRWSYYRGAFETAKRLYPLLKR